MTDQTASFRGLQFRGSTLPGEQSVPTAQISRLIQCLHDSAQEDGAGKTDGQLLDSFVHDKNDAALAALVQRHGPMVWGVCCRLLRGRHDSEDAFQATFLVLVQKAATFPDKEMIGNWLYGVAHQTAVRMRAIAIKRCVRERQVADMPEPTSAEEYVWNDLKPVLDEELRCLPDKYRVLIVLCDLEGKTRKEVARQLAIPEGTVASRVATARAMLAKRLARRGVVGSGVLMGEVLSSRAASAGVPMTVVSATIQTASQVATGRGAAGTFTPTVATLMTGVTTAMYMSKIKSVLAVVLIVGVAFGGAGIGAGVFNSTAATAQPGAKTEEKKEPPGVDKAKANKPDDASAVAAHIKALGDPDSETRAVAAAALRQIIAKYPSGTVYLSSKDGGEATWQKKLDQVKPGMTKKEVLKVLPEAIEGLELASGDSHLVTYRLDHHWMVTVDYRNPDKVISTPVLKKFALQVDVAPPKDFTGTWTTWHVNGQKGRETHYKDGKYDDVLTSYHDNGTKSVEQHYVNQTAHGADTGWYPNGKPAYTARYTNGKQDGTWTHWHANGIKHSETNYDKGKYNGRNTYWHDNGQIGSVNDYIDSVKNGIEASWDENGRLQYERIFANGKIVKIMK